MGAGVYAYKRIAEQLTILREQAALAQQIGDEAKHKYIYDSQQRAADDALMQVMSTLEFALHSAAYNYKRVFQKIKFLATG